MAAQNARDMETLKSLLLDAPNFLWVVGGTALWGRDAALQGFIEQCHGAFYLDPGMAEFRTIELTSDVVQLYVPAVFIPLPPPQRLPQPAQAQQLQPERYIISQTMVKHRLVGASRRFFHFRSTVYPASHRRADRQLSETIRTIGKGALAEFRSTTNGSKQCCFGLGTRSV